MKLQNKLNDLVEKYHSIHDEDGLLTTIINDEYDNDIIFICSENFRVKLNGVYIGNIERKGYTSLCMYIDGVEALEKLRSRSIAVVKFYEL
jgi:hypothetical protein